MEQAYQLEKDQSPIEKFFGWVLNMAIGYGVPLMIFAFGAIYVWAEISRDMNVGVRSLAAALLPLTIAFSVRKSDLGSSASKMLNSNGLISFVFAFVFAMATAGAGMYMRQYDNVIPLGELAFSATLSLMVFGDYERSQSDLSLMHIGAVCGFLTYIVVFGISI
ncbi:MAG: hypothetical protein AAFV93_16220 [Chloroflexota bacterium]